MVELGVGKNLSTKIFVLVMGILLVGGLFATTAFYFVVNPPMDKTSAELSGSPVTSEPVSLILNLSSPDDNLMVSSPDLLVSGKTSPGATVLLSANNSDQILDTNKGDFSATVKLTTGVNEFQIAAFDDLGNSKEEQRTVYYSKEKL